MQDPDMQDPGLHGSSWPKLPAQVLARPAAVKMVLERAALSSTTLRTKSPSKGFMVHVPYWDYNGIWYMARSNLMVHLVLYKARLPPSVKASTASKASTIDRAASCLTCSFQTCMSASGLRQISFRKEGMLLCGTFAAMLQGGQQSPSKGFLLICKSYQGYCNTATQLTSNRSTTKGPEETTLAGPGTC